MIKIKASTDRVIVRPNNPEIITAGGIVIPSTLDQKIQKGTIVSVGPGKLNSQGKFIPTNLQPGTKIIFSPYAGLPMIVDDEKYLAMTEADVMAIYEADEEEENKINGDGKARLVQFT